MQTKTSISDEKVKEILIDGINSGANYILNKTNFYEHIRTLHKIEKQRCLRLYDLHYSDAQNQRNNIKTELGITQEKEAVRSGLKTKNDRLLILQKLVDECLEQLTTKQCNDTIIVDGGVRNIKRLMNQRELNDTRKTLKDLQQEISKIEGDYAPTRTDVTTKGEKINNNVDLSNVPTELLLKLDEYLKK